MSYYTRVNFYELFEVDPRASAAVIHSAYRSQLDMVSGKSLATYGLFVGDDVVAIQQRLEEAYQVLSHPEKRRAYDLETFSHSYVSPEAQSERSVGDVWPDDPADAALKMPPEDTAPESEASSESEMPSAPEHVELNHIDGPSLRAVRKRLGLTREAISARTKIAEYYLTYIEEERYGSLPPGLYLRSYLQQYAKILGIDADWMATEYLSRMESTEKG